MIDLFIHIILDKDNLHYYTATLTTIWNYFSTQGFIFFTYAQEFIHFVDKYIDTYIWIHFGYTHLELYNEKHII